MDPQLRPCHIVAQELPLEEAYALCALVWARSAVAIDLEGTLMASPECLLVLGRSLRQSLVGINLKGTNFAKQGQDLSGFRVFCSAIGEPSSCGLKSLDT